jgi:hypothetical protein
MLVSMRAWSAWNVAQSMNLGWCSGRSTDNRPWAHDEFVFGAFLVHQHNVDAEIFRRRKRQHTPDW